MTPDPNHPNSELSPSFPIKGQVVPAECKINRLQGTKAGGGLKFSLL